MDTPSRTIVKAVIWNILGLLMMGIVGFVATGSIAVGGVMALINTCIGFTIYLIYERIWSRISWGRHHA